MENGVNKNQWVAMFKELGLNESQMMQWHRIFEARHPEGHQRFLEWLGIKAAEIERIRRVSRAEST